MYPPTAVVSAIKDQISADLSGETVLLNLKSGLYYGLNEVGTTLWNLVQQPRRIQEIRDFLIERYAISPEQCDEDLKVWLDQLTAEGLVEVAQG